MNDAEAGSIGKLLAEVSAEIADMRKAHAADIARAVTEERAAVVTWLRGFDTDTQSTSSDLRWCIRGMANCIERGEHRREREPLEDDSIEYRDIAKED